MLFDTFTAAGDYGSDDPNEIDVCGATAHVVMLTYAARMMSTASYNTPGKSEKPSGTTAHAYLRLLSALGRAADTRTAARLRMRACAASGEHWKRARVYVLHHFWAGPKTTPRGGWFSGRDFRLLTKAASCSEDDATARMIADESGSGASGGRYSPKKSHLFRTFSGVVVIDHIRITRVIDRQEIDMLPGAECTRCSDHNSSNGG